MQNVTVRALLTAMVEDTTPKAKRVYERGNGATCALGGATKALGFECYPVGKALINIKVGRDPIAPLLPRSWKDSEFSLFGLVTNLNDGTNRTKATIGQSLLDTLPKSVLDQSI